MSVRVQTEQYDVTDDDGALLCTVRLSAPTVTVEGRDAAQSAIQAVLDQMADQRQTEAEQIAEIARSDRPMVEQYTTFQGYGATDSLDLGRLDGCTINLLWTTSDNIGGAHGTTMTTAFAFDAETGERLSLSDVAINADALSMQLEEQVLQQMEQAPEQYFSDAQQWVPPAAGGRLLVLFGGRRGAVVQSRCAGSVQRWNAEVYRDIRGPDGIAGRTVDTGPGSGQPGRAPDCPDC